MKGQDNLDALLLRVADNALENPDRPLLGLIDLAGLNLEEIVQPETTQSLFANPRSCRKPTYTSGASLLVSE